MKNKTQKIIDIELSKIIGLDEEVRDNSVGYYQPFVLVAENYSGNQVQICFDYDDLINIATLLKPYLESYEAEIAYDKEMYERYKKEQQDENS